MSDFPARTSQAVMNTFEFLPRVEDPSGRRALEHTCALMMVLDAEILKTVLIGDEIVTRLAG
jgi:hypothetical protein